MSFPRYPKYKDSGVAWLGDVPDHWDLRPFWTRYRRDKRTECPDEVLLSVYREHGVVRKSDRDDNHNNPSEDLNAYQLVEPEDLVINKMKAWQGSVAISPHRGIVSPAYFVYRPRHKESSRFLHYLMRSPRYITAYLSLSKGVRIGQWDLDPIYHSQMPILLPPPDEQEVIATFLEAETAKIDALIEEQRRLTELLKEKRQAVISHAVIKGLTSFVAMKASGVEWIGEVPAHWSVKPIGHLCRQLSYGFTNPMPTTDDGPYMLTANDIGNGEVLYSSARRTSEEAFVNELTAKSRPKGGDILITKDGTLGRVAVSDGARMCINQSVASLRVDLEQVIPEFLATCLQGDLYQARMIYDAGGTTIKHIYISRLAKMPVAFPLLPEQRAILAAVAKRLHKMDSLIREADYSRVLLQERRSALISAAVTGKIDVRNYKPQPSAVAEEMYEPA